MSLNPQFSVRNYLPTDYESVRQNLAEAKLTDPDIDLKDRLEEKVRRDQGSILVATIDDKVVGNVFMMEDGWTAFIFRLAVRKDYRKQGIGTALMQVAEKRLTERGAIQVAIFVDAKNEELKEYYKKQGYVPGSADYRFMYKGLKK